ncbi:MAG: M15 family metallopeptidase, partial [Myxococcales bacterium]|nr:M15 family metallopeptidase [Myxococcales bacterium]
MMTLSLTWGLLSWLALAAPAPAPAAAPGGGTEGVPDGLRCLREAYPDAFCGVTATSLERCGGGALPWDDGREKPDHDAILEDPDLEEMMRQRYTPFVPATAPPVDFEPGRVRWTPFFMALYGDSRAAVRKELVPVPWLEKCGGTVVQFNRRHGAAAALAAVERDLARELPPDLCRLAAKSSGTFNWRTVRGTSRRSLHSFAIAIDIGVSRSDYWDWNKPDAAGHYRYKNRYPIEIARIFERHGFVWGGRWYHFDTMHF